MVVVYAGAGGVGRAFVIGGLADVHAVVALVVTIPVECVVLICIYLILLRLSTPPIIIEHRVILIAVATHFYLSRVLERQVLLPLSGVQRYGARVAASVILVIHLLFVIVLMRFRAVRRVLERQLRLRLINVLLLEVFVIIIENLVIHIEMLACVQ